MFALPSKLTPFIVLAIAKAVAVSALPVKSPVTSPVKLAIKVATTYPVAPVFTVVIG